ncbi:ATP-binding protein [Paraburkholderia sp. EG287B]|uniref:ATP-binding protein n=1 Tax=Paraburkholderia sp. EG287B TaxID=3237010 RepID=UPI0034D2890F
MIDAIAFQARARTIDHLGREQIADCPTAISELWKNSYDAYARAVHLHILDGEICTAALVDDGHGMSKHELLNKWLVLGTESKASGIEVPEPDRDGLSVRRRQGQKGIGRLSAAALGPLMLLVSKREQTPFVASMIDWRLFENPFLFLGDIKIPVVEFDSTTELLRLLDQMFDRLMGNIWGDNDDPGRNIRLADAWRKFDKLEECEGKPSTRSAIEDVLIKGGFTDRQLAHWPVWTGERPHGTAMIVADIAFDLRAQLSTGLPVSDEAAAESARDRLTNTLNNFTDPYAGDFIQPDVPKVHGEPVTVSGTTVDFAYGATAWEGALNRTIVSDVQEFATSNLEALEHVVDGWVDAAGVFRGRIKAFGKWLDEEVVIGTTAPMGVRSDSRVGPFGLRLATFEQELKSTTHDSAVHASLLKRSDLSAGFFVFRDGLRVMPYGREDNDFFEIERRRGMHAGREFWSIRRLFGRVALTMEGNPNLKDKAGREGFIDNKAAKVFRDVVENVLRVTARRFFGSDSSIRKQILPQLHADFDRQRAESAQKKLGATRRKNFRKNLDLFLPEIATIRGELEEMVEEARSNRLPEDEQGLLAYRARLEGLRERQSALNLGTAPSNLGALEKSYKEFRSNMGRSSDLVVQLRDSVSVAIDRVKPRSQSEVAHSELSRNASYLHARIRKWAAESRQLLAAESQRLGDLIEARNKAYHAATLPLLNSLDAGAISLSDLLRKLDIEKESQDHENERLFRSYVSTLQSLAENVDLESLVAFTLAENASNKEEIQRLNALAQLGITVEIVSHEIAGFDGAVRDGLKNLPDSVKNTSAYLAIKHGHDSLSERLRFLAPLKLSGERAGQWIGGGEIVKYVKELLESSLHSNGILLEHSDAFDRFQVFDQFARLLPVFINLVNNAIYWVARSDVAERKVVLDVAENRVFVCDNGPGVEPEDVGNLFSLFFTRKLRGGRGVGLYLCRANLAAAGHAIEYITNENMKRLPGANFAIAFNGARYE